MIRYHPEAYDRTLDSQVPAARRVTEETFAGLRFVRNQMGRHRDPADFVQPPHDAHARVTESRWKQVPAPLPGPVPPRGLAWEISRHQAYQAQLAGHAIGDAFTRAPAFLSQVLATVSSPAIAAP